MATSWNTSHTACYFFQRWYTLVFHLCSCARSLLRQASLPHWLFFWHLGTACSCTWNLLEVSFLKYVQNSVALLFLKAASKGTFWVSVLSRPLTQVSVDTFFLILTQKHSTISSLCSSSILPKVSPIYQTPTTSASLPAPSEEQLAIHCTTPVMWVISPSFCDGDYVIILLLLLLFVSHTLCINVHALQLGWWFYPWLWHAIPETCLICFPLQTQFKTLSSSPANSWARILFPLLDKWTLSCLQQAWCQINCPHDQTLKMQLVAPAFKALIDHVGFPVPFGVHSCYWRNWGEDRLCSCPFKQATHCLKVLFDYPVAWLINLITADLNNQQWATLVWGVSW